jgi:hypothetical protein
MSYFASSVEIYHPIQQQKYDKACTHPLKQSNNTPAEHIKRRMEKCLIGGRGEARRPV